MKTMELNLFTPEQTNYSYTQTEGVEATNFINLISLITKRNLMIDNVKELLPEKEYFIYKYLPLTDKKVGFLFKTPKDTDNFLKSFITQFTNKYKEPDPKAYDYSARVYGEKARYENKTELEKEYCYTHHSNKMFSKSELLKQIEDNFSSSEITKGLIKYGFYPTLYGIGIFCFWYTKGVEIAINEMKNFLKQKGISYTNEFSSARWVFRFKIGLTKEMHNNLIKEIN